MSPFRRLVIPLLAVGLCLACGSNKRQAPDTLLLSIRADATVEGVVNRLRFLISSPDQGLYQFEQFINFGLKAAALHVELKQGQRFKGQVQLMIVGLVDQTVVASATLRVDLAEAKLVSVNLRRVGGDCDIDADGVRDCKKAGCCLEGELSDCNDQSKQISPFVAETLEGCERTHNQSCRCGNGVDENCDGSDLNCEDKDGDRVPERFDCDDENKDRFPGNTEVCGNDIDEDCDGKDEVCPVIKDKDKDGFDSTEFGGKDCNDDDANVNPNKPEICGNDVDENCDGTADICISEDIDGDGVNNDEELAKCGFIEAVIRAEINPNVTNEPCCPKQHKSLDPADARKLCDWNCDGSITFCAANDEDEDGYDDTEDCNDKDKTIHPGAPEKCGDGIDQDCKGGDLLCNQIVDEDGDGYAAPDDCNDKDKLIHPGAPDICDGVDNNCDGVIDEGNPDTNNSEPCPDTLPLGSDQQPLGQCTFGKRICEHAPNSSPSNTGCYGAVLPQNELCDGKDNDCDGEIDEEHRFVDSNSTTEPKPTPYLGQPCTGLGECKDGVVECPSIFEPPVCSTLRGGSQFNDKIEICDGKDNDCDGQIDEDFTYSGKSIGQSCIGVGLCGAGVVECDSNSDPTKRVATCSSNPLGSQPQNQPETCDLADNDCDGTVDNNACGANFTCVDSGGPKCLCDKPEGCPNCGPANLTCVKGEQCLDGLCRCSAVSFCPPGFECENGLCRCNNPAGCDCRGALCLSGELCDPTATSCHCGNKLSDPACNRNDTDSCSPSDNNCICSDYGKKCPKDYDCKQGKCRCTKKNCSCGKGKGCNENEACNPDDTCSP